MPSAASGSLARFTPDSAIARSAEIEAESAKFRAVLTEIGRVIVGQPVLLERLLIGLLADGHILLEGLPGLAKTLAVRTLAATIDCDCRRVQFTPDLLPADLVGTLIYNQRAGDFTVQKGPIFTNILLADEVNRAPAKVQSALLEAMQEKQVTIGGHTFPLEEPFLVLATQNPIENEGTYPLPEAQLDRFMLKVRVGYPTRDQEKEVLLRRSAVDATPLRQLLTPATILGLRETIAATYLDQKVVDYIVDLVRATRDPSVVGLANLKPLVAFGASPRASIALAQAARAHAFLRGRGYVIPEDVRAMALDVLRHRVLLTFEAEAEEVDADQVVTRILDAVPVP